MRNPWNAIIAEMAGTFLFFFVGIGAVGSISRAVSGGAAIDGAAALVVIALAHGVTLAVIVSALGAVSGGHVNPAVTFGVWVSGQIHSRRAGAYIVAQLIGAILAAWSLRLVFPADVFPELGVPRLSSGISPLVGIFVEAVLTAILLLAVFGTAIDPRGPKIGGLAIGFAIAADILMGGPLTGGAMNPARWFGPAAVTGIWDDGFVWILGPAIGAAVAALAYRFIFQPGADLERSPAMPEA